MKKTVIFIVVLSLTMTLLIATPARGSLGLFLARFCGRGRNGCYP